MKTTSMSELEWMKIFGDNLRDMLIENDMSQNELARAIGVSQATVNRYIKGQIMPSTKVLVNICHVLDAELDDILYFGDRIR